MPPKDPVESMETIIKNLIPKALEAVNRTATRSTANLVRQHMSGHSDTSLGRRTKLLSGSTKAEPAKLQGTIVSSEITTAAPYARIHIKGGVIKAKKKFLTIPTDFALTNAGVAKARMVNEGGKWTFLGMPTFIQKGVIFGYAEGANRRSEGMRQRRAAGQTIKKGETIPLFILKGSVVIKRRIDPLVDVVYWAAPVLAQELKRVGIVKVG